MKGIHKKNGNIHIGALTTFEEFSEHPLIIKLIPEIKSYMHLIASWQIRTGSISVLEAKTGTESWSPSFFN